MWEHVAAAFAQHFENILTHIHIDRFWVLQTDNVKYPAKNEIRMNKMCACVCFILF